MDAGEVTNDKDQWGRIRPNRIRTQFKDFDAPAQAALQGLKNDRARAEATLLRRRSTKRLPRIARRIGTRFGGLPTAPQVRRAEMAMRRAGIFPSGGWEDL